MQSYVIKVKTHNGEWMTATYFGQDDNILPCVFDTYEQAEEASKAYVDCKIEKYIPKNVNFF